MFLRDSLHRVNSLKFIGCNTESGNKVAGGKWQVAKIWPSVLLYLYQYIFFKLDL